MDVASLISHYGLFAVFAGALLEGETLLLLAGYAAHRGYLDWGTVVAAAWAGAATGDQFFFWLGRRHGRTLVARRPRLAHRVAHALRLVDRHSAKVVLVMRFLWGSRIALPVALGMGRTPRLRFALFDLAAALLWALLVAGAGYGFGGLVADHAVALHRYEHRALAGVLLAALLWRAVSWWRSRAGPRR